MYKYRINELLSNLPMKDYRKALKVIPKVLGISFNTFTNYRSIKVNEDRDIPYQKVVLLEKIFELRPGSLQNIEQACKPISQLLNDYGENTD